MSKKIVFRLDASPDIGLGHLMRCLAIAMELKKGNEIVFATIKDENNNILEKENFDLFFKKENEMEEQFLFRLNKVLKPDVVIIDKKFPYTRNSFLEIKQDGSRIIIIDNICEGLSAADEIIFPNDHLDKNLLKEYLSSEEIKKVKSGPEYVIIRDEIRKLKQKKIESFHKFPVVVITTGGSDPEGVLLKIIPWLRDMNLEAEFHILVGKSFKFRKKLKKLTKNLQKNFIIRDYSFKEFLEADIVICTFGVTVYEMIYLKLLLLCISQNQENSRSAEILNHKYKLFNHLGQINDLNQKKMYNAINKKLKINMIKNMKLEDNIDACGTLRISKLVLNMDNLR